MKEMLFAKSEPSYDPDPALVMDATDAVLTSGFKMTRYAGDPLKRDLDKDDLGNTTEINSNPHCMAEFAIEAAGSGTKDLPAQYGRLLRACGFDEEIVAGEKVIYTLPKTVAELRGAESVSIQGFDPDVGLVQHSSGARGAVDLSMGRGEIPKFNFKDFKGGYSTPGAGIAPDPIDWTGYKTPLAFTDGNIPLFSVDGYTGCLESFKLDYQITTVRRNLPGCSSTLITGYTPTIELVVQAPLIIDKNFFTTLESHKGVTLIAANLTMGNDDGEIIETSVNEAQLLSLEAGDSDGIRTYSMRLSCIDAPVIITR